MFFTAINQMMTEGVDLTIVIRKANGQMAVSTLPKSNGLKDEAQNHIVPLTVSGLPEELDAGFLQTVARPIQKVAGLITNMAQFEAQADKAAADSKAAKEEKAKETKEEKEKREKYEKHTAVWPENSFFSRCRWRSAAFCSSFSTQQMWPLSAGLRVIRRWRRSAAVWRSSVFLST